jgi:translation initiation factor IF-3
MSEAGGSFIRKGPPSEKETQKGPRVNKQIKLSEVRLIDDKGENHGVVTMEVALKMAEDAQLDLVEISPLTDPPVCKILDYGKFRFEAQKKASLARKKQKVIEVKEIKMRPGIDIHDFDVKIRAAEKFLGEGNKVKVTLRFRGREMAHQELGMKVLDDVSVRVKEIAKVEQTPKIEGRQITMIISPK